MAIQTYGEVLERMNARNKPALDLKALRTFMKANYQDMTLTEIAEQFGITAIEVKRYAKQFRILRYEKDIRKLPPPLQRGERLLNTGVVAKKKNRLIHKMY